MGTSRMNVHYENKGSRQEDFDLLFFWAGPAGFPDTLRKYNDKVENHSELI